MFILSFEDDMAVFTRNSPQASLIGSGSSLGGKPQGARRRAPRPSHCPPAWPSYWHSSFCLLHSCSFACAGCLACCRALGVGCAPFPGEPCSHWRSHPPPLPLLPRWALCGRKPGFHHHHLNLCRLRCAAFLLAQGPRPPALARPVSLPLRTAGAGAGRPSAAQEPIAAPQSSVPHHLASVLSAGFGWLPEPAERSPAATGGGGAVRSPPSSCQRPLALRRAICLGEGRQAPTLQEPPLQTHPPPGLQSARRDQDQKPPEVGVPCPHVLHLKSPQCPVKTDEMDSETWPLTNTKLKGALEMQSTGLGDTKAQKGRGIALCTYIPGPLGAIGIGMAEWCMKVALQACSR